MVQRLGKQARKQDGFTLIELIVVVAILGILAAVLTPRVLEAIDNARTSAAEASAKQIQLAMERHMIQHNVYPTEGAILGAVDREEALAEALSMYTNLDPESFTLDEYIGFSDLEGTVHVDDDDAVKFYRLEITFGEGEINYLITPSEVTRDGDAGTNQNP